MPANTPLSRALSYLVLLLAIAPLAALVGVWLFTVVIGFFPGPELGDQRAGGMNWLAVVTIGAAVAFAVDMLLIPLIVNEPRLHRRRLASGASFVVAVIAGALTLAYVFHG